MSEGVYLVAFMCWLSLARFVTTMISCFDISYRIEVVKQVLPSRQQCGDHRKELCESGYIKITGASKHVMDDMDGLCINSMRNVLVQEVFRWRIVSHIVW
jgi:hypothetical protein